MQQPKIKKNKHKQIINKKHIRQGFSKSNHPQLATRQQSTSTERASQASIHSLSHSFRLLSSAYAIAVTKRNAMRMLRQRSPAGCQRREPTNETTQTETADERPVKRKHRRSAESLHNKLLSQFLFSLLLYATDNR